MRLIKKYAKLLPLVLSLFLIAETVRLVLAQPSSTVDIRGSMERGLKLNPADAKLSFRLARLYHLYMLDGKIAEEIYIKSLYSNPLLTSSWLGLAELYAENGKSERARLALKQALKLAPSSMGHLWEGSILALRLGDYNLAAHSLKRVAEADPSRRKRVFDISWQQIGDPDLILERIITDEILPSYLKYLISTNRLEETLPVWEKMKQKGSISKPTTFSYIDYLIRRGESSKALAIWRGLFHKRDDQHLVWNGGFEEKPIGRGFDWRVRKVEEVKIDFDSKKFFAGKRSLRLTFSGEHNVNFAHISQVVPVDPDSHYLLTSFIATDEITTRNGVSWEVYCYPKGNMRKSTDPITGTNGWRKIGLNFHTPSDCNSVVIRIRRFKSNKLDRYISGTAWIDEVKLIKLRTGTDA